MAGNGGTGTVSTISGARVFYAGGGGGGSYHTSVALFPSGLMYAGIGAAGGGDGGNGATPVSTSAIANSGSGGGGPSSPSNGGADLCAGGNGGSGIVILRYPSYLAPATSTTGSPETYVTGAWRVYKFVASGTITF